MPYLQPSVEDLACILLKCRKERNLAHALRLHAYIRDSGLEAHTSLGNYLVSMLVEVGSMCHAQQVFDRLVYPDECSWNSLIAGYVKCGEPQHALTLNQKMLEKGSLHPNEHGFVALLKACATVKDLERGHEIHAEIARKGLLERDIFICSSLVDMYAKCGSLVKAQDVFDKLSVRNIYLWNVLIAGYVEHGHSEEALNKFEQMQVEGISPDAVTFVCSLKACGSIGATVKGHEIHAEIARKGLLEGNVFIGSTLVDMYAKCGFLAETQEVFDKLPFRDVFSWTALMAGYAKHGRGEEALDCFEQMQHEGVSPSTVTIVCSLKACGRIGAADKGREIHAEIARTGLLDRDIFVGSTLVDMYAKCGSLAIAQEVFDKLPHQNVVSWNALIAGYVEDGNGEEALECFKQMQCEGISPDSVTLICSLKACRSTGATDKGQEIHVYIVKKGLERDLVVGSTLVDMYAKCSSLTKAREVLDKLSVRNVITWNALIAGYSEQGYGEEAVSCFKQMQQEGIISDVVTLVCCLKACGSIETKHKGQEIHAEILRKGLEKDLVVGNTLVDMYAKCGSFAEAQEVFDKLLARNEVSWNVLIAGYVERGHGEEALNCLEQMQHKGISLDAVTLVCSLKACGSIGATEKGQEIHIEIAKKGLLERDVFVGSTLVDMYAKCGSLAMAQEVFDKLSVRNVVSWNALITGFVEQGHGEEALNFIEQMQHEGISPDAVTLVCSLKACGIIGATDKGQETHAAIVRKGLERDVVLGSTLVDMYAKCGSLAEAQEGFDMLPVRNVVSWNTLITDYVEHGHGKEALDCFGQMQYEGISPDAVTLVCSLKACANIGARDKGRGIHAEITRKGLERELLVSNTLVDMYAKCGSLADAQEVFDKIPVGGTVSWNALIAGFVEHRHVEEVIYCFEQMQHEGVCPDAVTFVCILKACGSKGSTDKGREIHAEIARKGFLERDVFVGSALVDMYANCGSLAEAQKVFDKLPIRFLVLWNALISGYGEQGHGEEALNCFEQMQHERVSSDPVTFVCCLKACGSIRATVKGREIHAEVAKKGLEREPLIGNTLVDMYDKCGSLVEAREVFDKLVVRDVVSWTTLIAGYAGHGCGEEALDCFEQMQQEGASAGAVTFACSLKACGSSGATIKGQEIHAEITRKGLEREPHIGNTLVDMYAKCGLLATAREVFDKLIVRDVVSWNALIAGYAQLGESKNVFHIFYRMIEEGIKPDLVTFISVLNACSHAGLVDKGRMYFEAISNDYGFIPTIEHYTCMVDLLGRAGHIDKAIAMIKKMPFHPGIVVWHIVLGACRKWGNVELGRHAFEHVVRMDEKAAAAYVCMSNIYADAGMQEEANKVEAMRVKKQAWEKPGQSWWMHPGRMVHSIHY